MYKIYKITNQVNQKAYIGFTKLELKTRLEKHRKDAVYSARKTALCHAIRKYGIESFQIECLYESDDFEHTLNEMETQMIHQHKTHCSFGQGYNMTFGGEGSLGMKPNEETREKIRQSSLSRKHSQATKNKLSEMRKGKNNPNFGKKLSEEQKQKIGHALTGSKNGRAKEFLVKEPSGSTVLIDDRKKYCEQKELNYWSVCSATKRGKCYKGYFFKESTASH